MAPVIVTTTGLRDILPVYRLQRRCFGRDAWPLLDVALLWLNDDVTRLAIRRDVALVAFAAVTRRRAQGVAWIATLSVHPDDRRQGLGRHLLQACETAIRLPVVRLTVRTDNAAAIALYTQAGYHTVRRRSKYYHSGADGFEMEKRLA